MYVFVAVQGSDARRPASGAIRRRLAWAFLPNYSSYVDLLGTARFRGR